jgi:hypothetical protein
MDQASNRDGESGRNPTTGVYRLAVVILTE